MNIMSTTTTQDLKNQEQINSTSYLQPQTQSSKKEEKDKNNLNIKKEESEDQSNSKNFISDTSFTELKQALPKNRNNLLSNKIINQLQSYITDEAKEKFVKHLAASKQVLNTNKIATSFELNTMTEGNGARGTIVNLDTTTTQGDYVSGAQRACHIAWDTQVDDKNVGFPVRHKKIDELLVARLTESLGKQSPENGKVWDIKGILNANMLPVIKNGSITQTHRIMETYLLMKNAAFNSTDSGVNIDVNQRDAPYVRYFDVRDLTNKQATDLLETEYNMNWNGEHFGCANLVSKSSHPWDQCADLTGFVSPLLQDNYCADTNLFFIHGSPMTRYGPHPYHYLRDQQTQVNMTNYFDITPGNSQNRILATSAAYVLSSNAGNTTYIYVNTNAFDKGELRINADTNEDTEIVKNHIAVLYARGKWADIQLILENGSVTIGEGDDAVTYQLTIKNPDEYNVSGRTYVTNNTFENYADILNAIHMIAVEHYQVYRPNQNYGMSLDRIYSGTSPNPHVNLGVYYLAPSSIWARIAMGFGQLEYINNHEYCLGDQSLIRNKAFNYAYWIAGSYAKFAEDTYGGFYNLQTHAPQSIKVGLANAWRCLHYKHDTVDHYVPIMAYPASVTNITYREVGYNFVNGTFPVMHYFTESRWWRYDYFGGFKSIVPKQKISPNRTDEMFTENDDEVFINVSTSSTDYIGSITSRFTPNGRFAAANIVSYSYCPDTAIKFKIPKIFKTKKFVKTVLLHGLDISRTAAPVWYGPCDCEAEIIDDGGFDEDVLDALF